jgi:hypothetical protein
MALKIIEREVIADNAINAAKVEDGTIVAADLATGFITNAHVKSDAAIATSKITGLATSATTDTTDADNIASGTLPMARLDTGTTANKIVILDGNAKLPAISGASLTGIESATVSTSDPVITTNPSGGVGTKWINKTSGEVYVCTDATAGANVWTNVGAGSGNVKPYSFQGSNYGYFYGSTYTTTTGIERVSLTSDGDSTDVGDQSVHRNAYTACTSPTHGYCCGGNAGTDVIDKFLFTAEGTMTDVGNLALARAYCSGQSSQTDGYVSGGTGSPVGPQIDKFSFSSDGNAVDWTDLSFSRNGWCGANSLTHGYHAGGWYNGPMSDVIDKFPFASQTNATDVGNLLGTMNQNSGACSLTYGYSIAGYTPSVSNVIQKWSFTTDGNSTDVGDVTVARYCGASCSSTTHGYYAGGDTSSGGSARNEIDKVSFASGGNATDVGDMSHTGNYMGLGSQY